MKAKKITVMALFTAIALIIFIVEAQIPTVVPVPGVKLGLANIVTVYSMFTLGPGPTFVILVCRIILGSVFSGNVVGFFYSATGGLLCYLAMLIMRKLVSPEQIWVCSVIGAVIHNIGQIAVAVFITRTPAIVAYLPILIFSGVITGVFTGLCAQFLVKRLPRL